MGWGFLEDAWDAASDAVDTAVDAMSDAGSALADAGGAFGGSLGSVIAAGADAVDTATFGLASDALGAADDYVFDPVDYLTGGAVNVDFDDGKFSVGAGFDGLASAGASIGESGITADGSVPGASFDLSATNEGLSLGSSAGIDFGPLPYADGHVEISPDGDVTVSGELQGTIPTPVGLLSGEVSGGFVATDQGWGTFVDADGALYMPSGTTIRGAVEASYMETEAGSHTSVAVEGSVSSPGIGTAGGSIDYERIEVGDDVVEGFHAEAGASGFGGSVTAEADYVGVDAGGVERSDWSGDVDVDLPAGVLGDDGSDGDPIGDGNAGPVADPMAGGDVLADPVAPEPDPVQPIDDLDQAIATADGIEASVDDMFSEL